MYHGASASRPRCGSSCPMIDDVAIVGAGPAAPGRRAASRARGARVTLFDPSHPREKPCGGGVTGRALALVAGAIDTSRLPSVASSRARASPTPGAARRPSCRSRRTTPTTRGAGRRQPHRLRRGDCSTPRARAGATLVPARVDERRARRRTAFGSTRRAARTARAFVDRRRRRQQPRPSPPRRAVPPRRSCRSPPATSRTASRATRSSSSSSRIRRAISGRFRARLTWRSASARRPTPASPRRRCARRPRRGSTTTGIAPGARLEPYSWPIPSLGRREPRTRSSSPDRDWCSSATPPGSSIRLRAKGIYFALLSGQWAADALIAGRQRRRLRRRACATRSAGAGARRAAQGGVLPAGVHALLMRRARSDSAAIRAVMADLIAGRQTLRRPEMAAAAGRSSGGLAWRGCSCAQWSVRMRPGCQPTRREGPRGGK